MTKKFEKNSNEYFEYHEKRCDDRLKVRNEFLKEKFGKSKLKMWFYKKHYDNVRYRAIMRHLKKIERKGVAIKRKYFNDVQIFKLYKYRYNENPYRKFCLEWLKFLLSSPMRHLNSRFICPYDTDDVFHELVVNLTIKGLYLALCGHSVTHKEQMHEVWTAREKLIKAMSFEAISDYKVSLDILEKFGIKDDFIMYDKSEYIRTGEVKYDIHKSQFNFTINPKNVESIVEDNINITDKEYRIKVLQKVDEIQKYYIDQKSAYEKTAQDDIEKAYAYIGKGILDWWD